MDLKEFLDKQGQLDRYILNNKEVNISDKELLTDTLLALQVEVSELANATRVFKYWSNKGPESRERILDEYSDIVHFLLSIANQLGFTVRDIEEAYLKKHKENYRRQQEGY
ncbi:hypothetical protein G8S49_01360 [Clostridium botulinum C]|uniref:dUTPase n=2 Tax=Clostridium botulinum TaxID=1491 RepID=A0A9Q4TPI5_CLOBO|nr:dUTPase [Clostridium botulinum]EGO87963.1 hypothetical protein CBCST_08424 [Clostridium botulinum C str. Stockholm]KEH90595.1 hypothetical protein Z963_11800 [Clostridium botulinum C/D str. It1]MCD3194224.1 hypothetical protein [Clostridium botulinum C]MCD3199147.1 hypothetical protein [Clostridium botulinum C]MCD3204622.1 hypothetical protein [Clostridium botulinum C]